MKVHHYCIIFFLITSSHFSQEITWKGTAEVLGVFSSENQNPFWFWTNTQTQLGQSSNFSSLGVVDATYNLSERASLSVGTSFFYRDEVKDQFQRRELYIQFKNNWLRAQVGSKSDSILQEGLSVSNRNFLMSTNARALPGLLLESAKPLKFSNTFSLEWGIGHYLLNDDRFVEDTRVHFKKIALHIKLNESNSITGKIQHYAQWAGNSPVFGQLRDDFDAFVDVFTATKGEEIGVNGEILNAVGNHLGSFYLDYQFQNSLGNFIMYHDHPFEDGSGTAFKNFPDGIWGINFEPLKFKLFNAFVYEFITTKDQSSANRSDNYFSNNVYRSGWTYNESIIGLPFIATNPNLVITATNSPIISNRVQVHHLGFSGSFKQINWQIKSSIAQSFGTFNNPFTQELNTWHNYLNIEYKTQVYGTFQFIGGWDTGDLENDIIAVGLGYRYGF